MKAKELINELINGAFKQQVTCDTIKAGNEEKELEKVAFTMFATVETVKKAKGWGADMLIVHEPTYYDHMDVM
ncbi:MAG: Nif3-like dinuclear metal center hexameric protein, partial [Clostridia bacterium]|nr:Nif3-like dinuclear metal center hexameric protein [Clostridia bacterium]